MKRILLLCIMALLFKYHNYATPISVSDELYNQCLTSPGVSNLFQAHFASTNLFSGGMSYPIPLYTIPDKDFPLSVTLIYNADGFKPRKHAGIAGYNWVLDAGGCITREVNLYPDESTTYKEHLGRKGMLHFIESEHPSPDSIYAFAPSVVYGNQTPLSRMYSNSEYDIDYLPDIFHFDFCGYHGSFMINNDGNPVIISGDYVEVDLSNAHQYLDEPSNSYSYFVLPATISRITIRTIDGYTYMFGGDVTSVGCSVPLKKYNSECFYFRNPVVNSWFLKQITAPNGRVVTFHYKSPVGQFEGVTTPLWLYNEEVVNPTENVELLSNVSQSWLRQVAESMHYHTASSATKECVLDSIRLSGEHPLTISFTYGQESYPMYPNEAYNITTALTMSLYNYQLNTIRVRSQGQTLKEVHLSYETQSSTENKYHWRFLKNVTIGGIGSYSFDYMHYTYPNLYQPFTNGLLCYDVHGYWEEHCLAGLMTKVTLPTGGWQSFTYDDHDVEFIKRYEEDVVTTNPESATGLLLYVKASNSGTVNGARIALISAYDKDGTLLEKKSYSYSQGVYYDRATILTVQGHLLVNNLCAYDLTRSHVGYSVVTENVFSGNNTLISKNKYYFAQDENTMASGLSINIKQSVITQIPNFSWGRYYALNARILMFGERLITPGKLLKKEIFLNGNTLSCDEYNYYNNSASNLYSLYPQPLIPPVPKDTIVLYSHYDSVPISRKVITYPDVHNQTTSFSYEGNNILQKTDAFQYDGMQRVKKQITFDSNNREYFTYYTYPDEIQASPHSSYSDCKALFLLKKKKQIGRPIEVYSGYTSQNNELVTSGKLVKYYTDLPTTPIGAPTPNWNDYHVYPSQEYNLAITSPISNYQPISSLTGTVLLTDGRYLLTNTYQFDNMLRPISVTPTGSLATTYTWDGFYPHTVSIGNQTTTYTSIPYVGITSITDPKGLTTYYDYDPYGRLVEVYHLFNNTKQIINAYDYHVSTE